MSTRVEEARTSVEGAFETFPVNVRIKISARWTAMLFVEVEAGWIGGSTVNQAFLLATTI